MLRLVKASRDSLTTQPNGAHVHNRFINSPLTKLEDFISYYFSKHFNLLFDQNLYKFSTKTLTFNRT